MNLLLTCLVMLGLAAAGLPAGWSWVRRGGSFISLSTGRRQSNTLAGLGTIAFSLICLVSGGLMARDVAPHLWPAAFAILAPVGVVYPLFKSVSFQRIDGLIAWVKERLDDGAGPTQVEVYVSSDAGRVVARALSIARPAGEPAGATYRERRDAPPPAYVEAVKVEVESTSQRAWRRLKLRASPLLLPPLATAYFALIAPPLEALGWQVLATCCGLAAAEAAVVVLVRRQLRRASGGVLGLLSATRRGA